MDTNILIEITIFKTKNGVDEAEFMAADASFSGALREMGGFIKRNLLQGENDVWVDEIYWQTLVDAQHSAATIASHPKAQAFINLVDSTYDSQMIYLKPIKSYV